MFYCAMKMQAAREAGFAGKTAESYEDGLTIFRRYVTDVRAISMDHFRFEDLTYDFLLDYRVYLVDQGYKANTVNHRLAVITAYMKYVATKRTALCQIYMNISEVPYVTVPSRIREIIEEKDAIRELLAAPGPSKKGVRDQTICFDVDCDAGWGSLFFSWIINIQMSVTLLNDVASYVIMW